MSRILHVILLRSYGLGLVALLATDLASAVIRIGEESSHAEENVGYDPSDNNGYKIDISISRPDFSEAEFYEELYGSNSLTPSVGLTYNFLNTSHLNFGLGLKLSYYRDDGFVSQGDADNFRVGDQGTDFVFVPYQFFARLQISPFRGRYVVFDLWAGYEELYFEELRNEVNVAVSTDTNSLTAESADLYLNSGWHMGYTVGAGVSILLNALDEESVNAAYRDLGVRYIYVMPFFEMVFRLGGDKTWISRRDNTSVDLGRTSFGLAFVFEG